MHHACGKKQLESKSLTMKHFCVLCRTKLPTEGSKEDIEQLRFWVERGRGWSMCMLADMTRQGIGVPKDDKRAFELYTMAAEQDDLGAIQNLGSMYVMVLVLNKI